MSGWAKDNNEKIKYIMGESCIICGYKKSNRALHIHHLDPKVKTILFNSLFKRKNMEKLDAQLVKAELETCCLLCANCHAEVHDDMNTMSLFSSFDESRWRISCKVCPDCNTVSNNPFYLACSCHRKGGNFKPGISDIINWDKIDVLLLLHRHDGNFSSAGRELSISDNAVRKAFRKVTSYRFYEDYLKEKDIFSFDDGEVILNHVFVNKF